MNEWRNWGYELVEKFLDGLEPENLAYEHKRYVDEFGDAFGVQELLKVQDIKVRALVAKAIANVPEYMGDQIGLLLNSNVPTASGALDRMADLLEEKLNE